MFSFYLVQKKTSYSVKSSTSTLPTAATFTIMRWYLLPPGGSWLQHISVKVQPHQPLPLLGTWQSEIHYFVNAVVYGPVKLLWLVTGQHQHEPAGEDTVSQQLRGRPRHMWSFTEFEWLFTCCSVLLCDTGKHSRSLWGLHWSSPTKKAKYYILIFYICLKRKTQENIHH